MRVLAEVDEGVLFYFLLVNSFYLVLLLSAAWEMRRHRLEQWEEKRWKLLSSPMAPSVSVLAPAYSEAATIVESVRALLSLSYPNLQVVVVNDGSPDDTMRVLIEAYDLQPVHPIYRKVVDHKPVRALYGSRSRPNLVVVDKENGGKADALNAALNVASGDLVCAIDADTLIEQDALQRMVRPFLRGENVLAAGGTIRVVNDSRVRHGRVVETRVPRHPIAGIQVVEYLRAFLFGRLGWNRLGGNLIISGAFGLFSRAAVLDAGGYLHDTVGEDMELIVRLRRRSYDTGQAGAVAFLPDPVAWTEVPESLRVLGRQRDRWHRGLADVLWRHRGLLFNLRYRALGCIGYPSFLFIELLAPLIEALGLVGCAAGVALGAINWTFALLFLLAAYGYGLLLSLSAVLMESVTYHRYTRLQDLGWLLLWAVAETVGYRQVTVWWRLQGLVKFVRGQRDWGRMERRGFAAGP